MSFNHKKKFGQNFLTDQNDVLERIMEVAKVSETETVLEIGPGEGALTELLLAAGKKVICVEIDRDLEKLIIIPNLLLLWLIFLLLILILKLAKK